MDTLDGAGLRRVSGDIRSAARVVIIGVLIVVVDVTVGGRDVVNDVVGMASLVYALHRLRGLAPPPEVAARVGRARSTTGLALLVVTVSEVVAPRTTAAVTVDAFAVPTGHFALLAARVTAEVATFVAVTAAFRSVARWADLDRATASWRTTWRLLLGLQVPGVAVALLAVLAVRAGTGGLADLAGRTPVSVALLIALFVPLVHLVVSLSRTGREAEAWRRPPSA